MNVLQAHARLCRAQDLCGGIQPGLELGPLVTAGLADLSGMLDDATDDAGLRAAVEHGTSLAVAGVITDADLTEATNDLLDQLAALEKETKCFPD
jgi:hypothetical protein